MNLIQGPEPMKVSRIVIIICCCLSVGYGLYLKYFAEVYESFTHISKAKDGMTRQQVLEALSTPDSTYWDTSTGDSLFVMGYKLPDADGSQILVKLRDDTVRSVKYHQ